MTSDFYIPASDRFARVTASLACLAFASPHVEREVESLVPVSYTSAWNDSFFQEKEFYTEADEQIDEESQLRDLERFAHRMLSGMVDAPPVANEVLKRHFWELL